MNGRSIDARVGTCRKRSQLSANQIGNADTPPRSLAQEGLCTVPRQHSRDVSSAISRTHSREVGRLTGWRELKSCQRRSIRSPWRQRQLTREAAASGLTVTLRLELLQFVLHESYPE